jgi:hypothetical protein
MSLPAAWVSRAASTLCDLCLGTSLSAVADRETAAFAARQAGEPSPTGSAPAIAEPLALLVSLLVQDGGVEKVDQGIAWFIKWGRQTHRNDPQIFWNKGRSPLRVALHLLQLAGVPLASLPQATALVEEFLYQSPWRALAVAIDANTPPPVLARVAEYPQLMVRMRVAGNPATPAEVLARLAADSHEVVRKEVAGNPATVWLIEANPIVASGCRAKAVRYTSADDARAALTALPLSERDTAITAIGH